MREFSHGRRATWTSGLRGLGLGVVLCLLGLQPALGQDLPSPDDYDYTLRAESAQVDPDQQVVVDVGIAARMTDDLGVQGWSYGVAHDPAVLTLVSAETEGTDVPGTVNPDASFVQVSIIEDNGVPQGFIEAVILSLAPEPAFVPVTEFFNTARATYDVVGGVCDDQQGSIDTRIDFTEELRVGDVPTSVVVTVGGRSVTPSVIEGVDISVACSDAPGADLALGYGDEDLALVADMAETVDVRILLSNSGGAFAAQGWQYAVAADLDDALEFVEGRPGEASAALQGGSGPAFASYDVDQNADGSVKGVVVGVVIELSEPGTEVLDVGGDAVHIDTLVFRSGKVLAPGSDPETTTLSFVNEVIGDTDDRDAIEILFVQNETGFPADFSSTKDIVLNAPDDVPNPLFRRGDANNDGGVDYTDGIWIIREQFYEGPESACAAAADANDDGNNGDLADAIYLIRFYLQPDLSAGDDLFPAPPAPFPNCGRDDDVSMEDCSGETNC